MDNFFFKEEEAIYAHNPIVTHGYAIPVQNRPFLIGRAKKSKLLKMMIIFRMNSEPPASYLYGIVSTATDQGHELFPTTVVAMRLEVDPPDKTWIGSMCWPTDPDVVETLPDRQRAFVAKYEQVIKSIVQICERNNGVIRATNDSLMDVESLFLRQASVRME